MATSTSPGRKPTQMFVRLCLQSTQWGITYWCVYWWVNWSDPCVSVFLLWSMKEIPERFPRKKLRLINRTTENYAKMNDNNYTPTEEDISHLLKDFILDFLLNSNNTCYIPPKSTPISLFKFLSRLQHAGGPTASETTSRQSPAFGQVSLSLAHLLLFALHPPAETGSGALSWRLLYWSSLLPDVGGCMPDGRVRNLFLSAVCRRQAVREASAFGREGDRWIFTSIG